MCRKIKYSVFYLIVFFSAWNCKLKPQKANIDTKNKYATHFHIQKFDNYSILNIYEAWKNGKDFSYVLVSEKTLSLPDSIQKLPRIQVPLQNIIVTSTTHLPALEALGVSDKLMAFPHTKYVSSPQIRKQITAGKITEIGQGMELNTEMVLKLNPQLLMVFSSGEDRRNYQIFEQNNIPVLYNADWMEATPLGRAEWIKVFGALWQKEKQADSIFNEIEKNYTAIQDKIQFNTTKPLVFQGGKFGDKWYVPGGKSYAAQLIADAGGLYAWQDNQQTGSMPLNYEDALLKLGDAVVWLNPGMFTNKKELKQELPEVTNIKAYRFDRIYTYNLTRGKSGGVTYFEYSNLHPDWVLSDLYHIFYPDTSGYQFHFYKKLPE